MTAEDMLGGDDDAEGVLKMSSKILDTAELKKLDKLEKLSVLEIHNTEKGEWPGGGGQIWDDK